MKDQFANYVVQKVLETCDDQQREMILTRIKAHLNTLKKYTYGKHIVARVEKLVAAGGMFCHKYSQIQHEDLTYANHMSVLLLWMQRSARGFNQHAPPPEGRNYAVVLLTVARFALACCPQQPKTL